MKLGQIAAFILIAAYLGLEAVAAARARDRMEPEAMYRSILAARVGVEECAEVPREQVADFEKVVDRFRGRLRDALAESDPGLGPAALDARIETLTRDAEAAAAATLAEEGGCDSFTGRRFVQRHLMYSRR